MESEERASRILSVADLIRLGYGDSPATLWRRVKQGIIPAPVEMGPGTIGWFEREIVAAERTRKRRTPGPHKSEQTVVAA
jgi:predicted DNA-binding transcriptional regulator AlpA